MKMTGATQDEIWPLVRDFHYSHKMPSAVRHSFAWREDGGLFGDTGEPLAGILYGNPVNRDMPQDALELQRLVRRDDFNKPLSEFICWTLRWLRKNTNTPFVLSYADEGQNHHGGIYQASGFIYIGHRQASNYPNSYLLPTGEVKHGRQVGREIGSNAPTYVAQKRPDWEPIPGSNKHIYVKPLRQKIKPVLRRLKQLDNDSRFRWLVGKPHKPDNAACLLDAPSPDGVSRECTPEAAPVIIANNASAG